MNNKITYSDFLEQVANKGEVSQELVHDLLAATIHIVEDGLNESGHAVIHGLGRFQLQWHDTREGRNPLTGETIQIPAHNSVKFKPDAHLRKFINRKYAHLKPKFLKEKRNELIQEEPIVEEEYDIPDSEFNEDVSFKKDKSSWRWWWLIIPVLIIIFAFLFWPSGKSKDQKEPVKSEIVEQKEALQSDFAEKVEKQIPPQETSSEVTQISSHQVDVGDNLWKIADKQYGSAYLWPYIYQANLNHLSSPDQLVLGRTLKVPALEGDANHLTQNDKANISEGFVHAYLYYKSTNPLQARGYLWVVKKWGMDNVLNKYKDQINPSDMNLVQNINGEVQI